MQILVMMMITKVINNILMKRIKIRKVLKLIKKIKIKKWDDRSNKNNVINENN